MHVGVAYIDPDNLSMRASKWPKGGGARVVTGGNTSLKNLGRVRDGWKEEGLCVCVCVCVCWACHWTAANKLLCFACGKRLRASAA